MALGLFSHLFRRSRGNQSTSVFAAFGPNVDEVVAHFQHVEVVLNDHHSVTLVHEFVDIDEQLNVFEMQACGGLVKDVQGASGPNPGQFRGEFDALRFTLATERGALLAQRYVSEAHGLKGGGDAVDFGDGLEKTVGVVHRHGEHVCDAFALYRTSSVSRLKRLP